MGIYAVPELLDWFTAAYPEHTQAKLDMGKSCIRFKKPELIPFALIAHLMHQMSVEDWIQVYEKTVKKGP